MASWHQRLVAATVVVALHTAGCGARPDMPSRAEYLAELEEWRAERDAALRAEDGWLTLVGLFWLDEGDNTFGSDPTNDVIFPASTRSSLGTFRLQDGAVMLEAAEGVGIVHDGEPVDSMTLTADSDGEPTVLEMGSLRFFVIERGGRLGVRIKDTETPALAQFQGMDSFDVDPSWRVEGRLERFEKPRTIEVPNVMGTSFAEPTPGVVHFVHGGRQLELTPVAAPGEPLFLVFGDATNGAETYGGGRFLEADVPDETGRIILDFNKAYNPPCVFTPYATCPLPPPENRLAVAIRAGEKSWGSGH